MISNHILFQFFNFSELKCKASFSCHSSSYHYSTQGFVLISFHFIFSFLKNKILCNFTCDLLFCLWISDLKCGQAKNSQANGSLRENVSVFWLHLLLRRNVGTRGHLRKEIILLKYQVFRFGTKSGGQFELLNWLEKSTRILKLKLKLELKLEDYDIVHLPSIKTVSKLERIRFRTFDCIVPNQNSTVWPVYNT